MTRQRLNFYELDSRIAFCHKEDLMKRINELGSGYVSDCVHNLYYYEKLSMRKIAALLSVTENCIVNWMNKWGMKRRNYKEVKNETSIRT